MDFAEASRSLHAVLRRLGLAGLVALLVLGLAATRADGQVAAPPSTGPGQTAPDQAVDDGAGDWNDGDPDPGDQDDHGWDDDDSEPAWPDIPGGARPPGDATWDDDGSDGGFDEQAEEELPAVTSTHVPGKVARMRTDGKAAIPLGAPRRVRDLIAQYNRIAGKRYKWGGGHAKLVDTGYDCSGAVGYGLIKGGLLRRTMVSGRFARWGAAGAGRWVTVYARTSHVYIEVAGLRLDTSTAGDRGGRSGVRWRPIIGKRRGFAVRHPVGL